ncbi:hypothetical protein J2741_001545 [Methanolinea mesophila]|uniref:hypothetical protein n=1 Tax=Methanolinea mesophila TaxID=547055 RepID=UPI001AE3DD47|nr:hypothetical protein [Methanolinea mesophila]MBP1928998.1 hypothetical protein [Methanolinea mesophila]
MRKSSIFIISIALAMVLSAGGFAAAATVATGDISETSSLVWTISSDAIDGVLVPGEAQSTSTYGESTHATGGTSGYYKVFTLDTANKPRGQYNVDSTRIFSFDGIGDGNGTGRAVSTENIGIDTMGMPRNASSVSVNPFLENTVIPAFHNTVNAGSSFDLSQGSLATRAQSRTVTPTADVPVALNYDVSLTGLGSGPAVGSAGAYTNGHIEEGRGNTTDKATDIVFSQSSTASGLIWVFDKNIGYESGISRLTV